MEFNGLSTNMDNLFRLSSAKSRSISPENFTGEKGKGATAVPEGEDHPARELGLGWKVSPSITIQPGETFELANIEGPGAIQQIWMTPTSNWRHAILRMYWDHQENPSVESPIGDFFACGWGEYAQVSSLAVCVNPGNAFNCYWNMPFKKHARITMTNINEEPLILYYQINYTLADVPEDAAYFHAQFRRTNPVQYKDVYTIVDGIVGKGHYVGTYMAWGVNNNGWWGEGEIKFYMDGDQDYPTICGTGTEDYFCGSYNFENQKTHQYEEYTTPYAGLCQVIRPDGVYNASTRFGMYRWHITDPVRFDEELKVDIQALGWRSKRRFLPLQDDIASVAYWYQTLPTAPFPALPDKDYLEII